MSVCCFIIQEISKHWETVRNDKLHLYCRLVNKVQC